MRINDLLSENNTRTDEFVQALAPLAGAAVRGVASLAARGGAAATDVAGNAIKAGSSAVSNAAKTGINGIGTGIKQVSNIKNAVSDLKGIMQQSSGSNPDIQKLTTALSTQAPGQSLDPVTMKSLQGMIPAIADALKNPQTANALKQALTTGVKADVQQDTQQQALQKQPGTVGSTGSTSNTIAPTA